MCWDDDKLFKIYIWNTLLSLGSLYVLFGAFQGTPFLYITLFSYLSYQG
jgi:hypothetical protein